MYILQILVGQIFYQEFSEDAFAVLKEHAEFKDTDDELGEFMVSTGFLENFETVDDELSKELKELFEVTKDYGYIHVTKT